MEKYNDDIGDDHEGSPISQHAAANYADAVHKAILRAQVPEAISRGLMDDYNDDDSVNKKVHSLFVDVEIHDGRLWGVATLKLTEPLTPEEFGTLIEEIESQYSDAFGEKFGQRDIEVDDGKLRVHLWSGEEEFYIITEREFRQRLGLKPLQGDYELMSEAPATTAPEQNARAEASDEHIKRRLDSEVAAAALCRLVESRPEPAPVVRAPDIEEMSALRLSVRLDQNLADYHASLMNLDKQDLIGKAGEIAAVNDAHFYLSEDHGFTVSEIEYLLQFQNPLSVVSDAWYRRTEDISDIRLAISEVFDKQDALHGDYPLIKDEMSVTVETEKETVTSKDELLTQIARKHCRFETLETRKSDSLDFRDVSVWGLKAALDEAYTAGLTRQIELTMVAGAVRKGVRQEHSAGDKPSVLDQIREAAKTPKEPHKDKPARDKIEPEH